MRSTNTAYGKIWYYGKDMYIGRSLHNYGEWSGEECEELIRLYEGGRFLDVGANIGFMSAAIASIGGQVEAFEPQPALYDLLCKNVPNAKCHNVAVSDSHRIDVFPRVRYSDRENFGGIGFGRGVLGSYDVECVPLDSFGYDDVSLIKIDVEGHELAVLKGAVGLINKCKPVLYVEDDRADKRVALRKFITDLGYKIEEHTTPLYRDSNFLGLKKNIWDKDYVSMNIICYP